MNSPRDGLTSGMSNAERLRTLRADAILRGLCQECRCRFPRVGRKTCDKCIGDKAIRKARNRAKQRCHCGGVLNGKRKQCAECRKKHSTAQAIRKRQIANTGICIRCEHMPAAPMHAHCFFCLNALADRARDAYVASVRRATALRQCSTCGATDHNRRRHER